MASSEPHPSGSRSERLRLTGAKKTLFNTLYCRAVDYRSKAPVLSDRWAADILDRIDYPKWAKPAAGDRFLITLRARQMDEWAREFLARQPDATVLQLACGLDSRAFRLELPPGVQWYDVDFSDVIDLRKRLYPERDNHHLIGSSVTDEDWLDQIPAGRPTLVIAEGLVMYLARSEVRRLVARLTDRFPAGQLILDVVPSWAARSAVLAGLRMWGLTDPACWSAGALGWHCSTTRRGSRTTRASRYALTQWPTGGRLNQPA